MGKQASPPSYNGPGAQHAPQSGNPATQDAYNQATPSPWQQAAEGQASQSHVGLNGAFGSSAWSQDPNTKQWSQSQTFAPGLQGTVNSLEGQIGSQGPIGSGQDAANAAYSQSTSRLDPQFAQGQEALSAQLAAQGLDPGTQAGQTAQGNFDRSKNDAYSSAQNNAWSQGLALRGQNMQAQQLPYQQLQALQGLLGGAQGVGSAGAPNYLQALGLQQGLNTNNADTQNQLLGSGLQGAGAAGAGAFSLSDERAKCKIRKWDQEVIPGVPIVQFEYRDHAPPRVRCVGVIAQDVQRVRPDLVRERPDGLLEVNYSGLLESAA